MFILGRSCLSALCFALEKPNLLWSLNSVSRRLCVHFHFQSESEIRQLSLTSAVQASLLCHSSSTTSTGSSFIHRLLKLSLKNPRVSLERSLSTHLEMPGKVAFERLSLDVVPSNYNLKLQPDLKTFTFDGSITISVEIKKAVKQVSVNSADIKITQVTYKGDAQEFGSGITTSYNAEAELVTFTFPEEIKIGLGTLNITFTGELNDQMKGFYRSKYTTPKGEEAFAAVTQFEATDARRAFPCWDEPAVKATFDVTLVVPKDKVTLSNMPVKSETFLESNDGLRMVTFERTPVMSTYLLAFVVGEYDHVEGVDSDGVKVCVFTPVGKKEQGKFALEVAVKTLPFYKDYFQIAYPLPKMDLIAIADFAAGAMENWGLVTYRETAVLIDPENSSSAARQQVALVVGHEIAHQWFGNLVTMEWWTHLWLNEGFASWIEYLCVDHCFPEYDIWTQFAATDFTRALELDALKNSHPIEVPVGHPNEVDEIFDAISYSKGASVIRMLHDYIGDKDYRVALNAYLTKHKYANTFTEDLWAALGETSGKPVHEIMSTWTKQMGYPVLMVDEKKEGTTRTLTITQEKFCAEGRNEGESPLWMVLLSISTASSPEKAVKRLVLKDKTLTVTLEDIPKGDWVKLNTGAVGFYRTCYSSSMLDALLPAIKTMPPRDRLGLQNDLFALARAGITSTVDVLKLAQAFSCETNYTVWSDLSVSLSVVGLMLQYTDLHAPYQTFITNLFDAIAKKLGWDPKEGEGHLDAMLRTLVLNKMGRNGHEPTIAEAKLRFADHCSGKAILRADLRSPVYSTVLTHGGEEEFNELLKLYKVTDLHEEKNRILHSLGATKEEKLIQKVLDFAMSDEVRSQDTVFVIAGVTGSVLGRELAWKFVTTNWEKFNKRYSGFILLARLVKYTTQNFITSEKAKEIEAFFKDHPAPTAERTIQQSLENIILNENQLSRDQEAIKKFLTTSG